MNNTKQSLPELWSWYRGAHVAGNQRPTLRVKLAGGDNWSELLVMTDPPGNLDMRYRRALEPARKKTEIFEPGAPIEWRVPDSVWRG